MKKMLMVVLGVTLMMSAGTAFGQAGAIMLYSDLGYTDCNLVDGAAGLLQVYAVHNFTAGATASQFGVNQVAPLLTYLSWTAAHSVTVGSNVNDGVAVTYNGGCASGPVLVGTISYFASGLSAACSTVEVVADVIAASGLIEGVDCSFQSTFPDGSILTINGDGSCVCGRKLPIEESTWGKVKSLYN